MDSLVHLCFYEKRQLAGLIKPTFSTLAAFMMAGSNRYITIMISVLFNFSSDGH